ncbi:hypothetical protein [Qipengyuania zhejiangensis]|uniref:hypothetical protein n=1 Tax=Qipengyuania zhejiangensis TaxID=3077782 RepID=UPI002D79B53F|nr:hypothetical protein [Qipengyuania sp. Z2]
MKKTALLISVLALAACGQEPAPEPVATETAAPEPVASLPAPDQALFTEVFGSTCEGAEPVNTAVCKRAGMGSPDVVCEFGLGEDSYLRHKATLTANEDSTAWVLTDPAAICAEHGAHHSAS